MPSAGGNTIACVVLTKNEEINIIRCLSSVAWCDECIVVDSGSTDRTQELTESNGTRFFVHFQPGPFNIAEQRNWALSCTGIASDWVLFLDADEEVPPELRAQIEHNIDKAGRLNAYELTPKYLFWGKWLKRTQGFPNWHARLVKRGEAGFVGGVWEHFDAQACIGRIAEPYNHYANSKGFSDWLARHDRYSTWDAERIVAFLESHDAAALATHKKQCLRIWAARFYPLRPVARFINLYFLRFGFVEGFPAFVFSWLYFFYEGMTVVKILELKRLRRNESL